VPYDHECLAEDHLKILVVDDHALVREGLRQVLRGLGEDVEVLDAANCGRAFELTRQHPDLDLVLLDYHLPEMNGQEALDVFSSQHPELPIVMLSGFVNPLLMRQVLNKGAVAFLTKSGHSNELLSAIRVILAGGVYRPPEPTPSNKNGSLDGFVAEMPPPNFTPRQEEVLQLLLDGYSNKEIGKMLSLSDETVKNHVSAILRGFEVSNRTQAVMAASRFGYSRSGSSSLLKR
jgi:DNA-binding NarL/FixJ family response regulator